MSTAAVGRHIIDDDIGVDGHTRSLAAGDHVLELGSRPSALRLAVRLVAAASANAREASTVENNNNPNKLLINETHFLSAPQVPSASAQIGEACRIPIVISGAGGSLRWRRGMARRGEDGTIHPEMMNFFEYSTGKMGPLRLFY